MTCLPVLWVIIPISLGFEIPTEIQTNMGKVLGVRHTELYTQKTVYEFRKIPYATPPVGPLRFDRPRPYGRWVGRLDATKFGPSCYQDLDKTSTAFLPNKEISEHCLFLNIYVPFNISKNNNKTVMVWIHGGDFLQGKGMTFNGAMLACISDVIVVTVNYRIGLFGFLSTGDSAAEGNYGLWDQRLALIWIRNCIKSYGGDPKSITVFGHSAGAMSISLHSLYKGNKDLFKRIILQSGFGTSPLSLATNVPHYTQKIARLVNCSSDNTSIVVDCLRQTKSNDLQNAFRDILSKLDAPLLSLLFGPRVCGKYIIDNPSLLLQNSNSSDFFQSLDLMIGNVNNEGSKYLELLQNYQKKYNVNIHDGIPNSVLCDYIAPLVASQIYNGQSVVSNAVCNEYGRGLTLEKQSSNQMDFYGDLMYYSPTMVALDIHSKRNSSAKLFQYIFKRQTALSLAEKMPSWVDGVPHGGEINFVFPFLEMLTLSTPDGNLAKTIMKYWTNFAKYGDVNDGEQLLWPEFESENRSYLELDVNVTVGRNFRESRMKFWIEDIPKILESGVSLIITPSIILLQFTTLLTYYIFNN